MGVKQDDWVLGWDAAVNCTLMAIKRIMDVRTEAATLWSDQGFVHGKQLHAIGHLREIEDRIAISWGSPQARLLGPTITRIRRRLFESRGREGKDTHLDFDEGWNLALAFLLTAVKVQIIKFKRKSLEDEPSYCDFEQVTALLDLARHIDDHLRPDRRGLMDIASALYADEKKIEESLGMAVSLMQEELEKLGIITGVESHQGENY